MLVFTAIAYLFGCASDTPPPLFDDISTMEVRTITGSGMSKSQFNAVTLAKPKRCLQQQTLQVEGPDDLTPPLLPNPILLVVTDRHATRSFEILTQTNLKTQARDTPLYFQNPCIYEMVRPRKDSK